MDKALGLRLPPPMRIVHKGWWIWHELSVEQAEAYHLRLAAGLVGQRGQAEHLHQAACNREEAQRQRVNDIFGFEA